MSGTPFIANHWQIGSYDDAGDAPHEQKMERGGAHLKG
jgi:hypothetical protein